MAVVSQIQRAGKAILGRPSRTEEVVMVPRKLVRFDFNMKHPRDPENELAIMKSVIEERLKDPLDCCQGRHRGEVECLDGEMRYRLIDRIQKQGKEVRLRMSGQLVPLGKVPVVGGNLRLTDDEARTRAAHLNLLRRNVSEMELGCHFAPMFKDAKHGEVGPLLDQVAAQVHRSPLTVRRWLNVWNNTDAALKKDFLGRAGLSISHFTQLARLQSPQLQRVAATRIKREGYDVRKTAAYVGLLSNAEEACPPARELTQQDAQDLDERIHKTLNLEPSIKLSNVSEWPFLKVATVIVDWISCPRGKQKVTYGRCPYGTLSEEAKKRCGTCQQQGYDLKLSKCNAAVRLVAQSDVFYDAVLRSAREIKARLQIAD